MAALAVSIAAMAQTNLQLNQLWEFSVQKGNQGTVTDDVKNGFAISNDGTKLYLETRNNGSNQVAIYNAATGERTGYLPALSGFYAQYGGDVAVDDNGAIYACNVIITTSGALQIAKWDSETDASPEIFISTTSHGGDGTYRIGYGMGVKIDASGNGFILMHKNGTSDFKIWKVNGGVPVSQDPITITATPAITDAYARISIVDNEHFWIDGNVNYPYYGTITWTEGAPTAISLTLSPTNSNLNKGVGGATEFTLAGKRYLVAARNNHGTAFSDKHSVILEELEATGVGIKTNNLFGPLPPLGLGNTTDYSHFVEPNVYVNGNTAYIYLMGGFNGITAFKLMPTKTFTVTVPNGTQHVYIAGSFIGKFWDINDPFELTATENPNEFTGTFPCEDGVEYKYLCEKGDWDYQEAVYQGSGDPIQHDNHTYAANDVVDIWYRVKSVTLNVSFEASVGVPNQLFLMSRINDWKEAIELTKQDGTFTTTLTNDTQKVPANTEYKYFTNEPFGQNWECNLDMTPSSNRWTIAPVMNDVIQRFTTRLVTETEVPALAPRLMRTPTGIRVELNEPAHIELYNINGSLIEKTKATGTYTRDLNNGIYIIRINGKSTKFVK